MLSFLNKQLWDQNGVQIIITVQYFCKMIMLSNSLMAA